MFSSRPQIRFKIRQDASKETILAKYHYFSNIKSCPIVSNPDPLLINYYVQKQDLANS